jgi:hypothetical protein
MRLENGRTLKLDNCAGDCYSSAYYVTCQGGKLGGVDKKIEVKEHVEDSMMTDYIYC